MSSSKPVRVRFAPSPTGMLHIGGMRSALFNWLWARHTGGKFVLRIEDTDRLRLVEGALEQILAAHDALGITPDEGPGYGGTHGPYIQSERNKQGIYRRHADELLKTGQLYPCWCSAERLTGLREAAQKTGVAFKYDRHCLKPANHRPLEEPHVLRFLIPDHPETIGWDDAVRGRLEVKTDTLDDFVAIKSDGFPTYQFANVVDDHDMAITHVLRADEWIPSTPKHLLVYTAYKWDPPVFAHLPAVHGPSGGKKLSKREGARSVQEYVADGYLPEALRSYLVTLGWNDGTTQEIYSTKELIDRFTLDRIQKSPARFDLERLTWVNGKMIRELWQTNPDALLRLCESYWPQDAITCTPEYLKAVLGLAQDRLHTLTDLPELTSYFFTDPDMEAVGETVPYKKFDAPTMSQWLDHSASALKPLQDSFTAAHLEELFRGRVADELGLGKLAGPLFMTLRSALTGKTATPGLFDMMAVLGPKVTIRRLQAAAKYLLATD